MSDIKSNFTSRFTDGYLLQLDYSQLEIRTLALLSDDTQLQTDLAAGIDMHCLSASMLTGQPYLDIYNDWKSGNPAATKIRKEAKAVSFLVQYGGGAKTAAEQTGVQIHLIKAYIKAYYVRYAKVKRWQDSIMRNVISSRRSTSLRTAKNFPVGIGYWTSPLGRQFAFREYDAPGWMHSSDTSFSPTQVKNYPTQGTGCDIVMLMIGQVEDRRLVDDYLSHTDHVFVNTVHDSMCYDCSGVTPPGEAAEYLIGLYSNVAPALKRVYDVDCNVAFPVSAEYGETWGAMAPIS